LKILSVECSATPCSVAIWCDGEIIASDFTNEKMTHSQTLMPMVKSVLKDSNTDIKNIECFAVSAGPGSFTGIRIGISAIKGMAAAKKVPCVPISTLRCMAENYKDTNCIVCAVMDARCNQVYNAIFKIDNGIITRLCDDRALLCEELAIEIKDKYRDEKIVVVGDGAAVFYPFVEGYDNILMSDGERRYQNAVGVAFAAEESIKNKFFLTPEELQPVYLRLPQAERELKRKKESER